MTKERLLTTNSAMRVYSVEKKKINRLYTTIEKFGVSKKNSF